MERFLERGLDDLSKLTGFEVLKKARETQRLGKQRIVSLLAKRDARRRLDHRLLEHDVQLERRRMGR